MTNANFSNPGHLKCVLNCKLRGYFYFEKSSSNSVRFQSRYTDAKVWVHHH